MSKDVLFYLIDHENSQGELTAREALACHLAAVQWRNAKKILIACTDQAQAERLDEALWQNDPTDFVPHNLAGEGARSGSPIELCWHDKRSNQPRDLLITLSDQFIAFTPSFYQIIDFVPFDEQLKQQARARYKIYRNIGFKLHTKTAPAF